MPIKLKRKTHVKHLKEAIAETEGIEKLALLSQLNLTRNAKGDRLMLEIN
jgi:hypothetical protein